MAYRGGDLDLRTPRTWSASVPEPAPTPIYETRPRGAYTPGPIWVDEVVLACVNHAYDVALAHRAAEVRLEHLLHALTRIDTAAEVLEIRGIRVSTLRRESATAIASELPVGLPTGEAGPRHSEELEHVLRAASLIASRRNAPASVDDLLHLMLDVEPDLPGLGLLARIDQRFAAPTNGGSYTRTQRSGYNARYVTSQPEPQPAPTPPQPQYTSAPYAPREAPRPPRGDFGNGGVDTVQNSRLDALEQMMRALSADLGTERKTFTGLMGDLQREVTGLRASPVDISPIADRVATIERSVTAGFEQFSLALASIENDIRARAPQQIDLTPLNNRLEIIEEAVLSRDGDKIIGNFLERIDRLETTLAGERTRAAEAGAALRGEVGQLAQMVGAHRAEILKSIFPFNDRFSEVRSSVDARHAETGETLRALADRVAAVERLVTDTLQKVIEGQTAAREDLAEVSDAIVKLNANQHTLAGNIEQTRNDTRETLTALRDDVGAFRENFAVTAASLTSGVDALGPRFSIIEGETQRIGGAVEGLSGTVENMHRVTIERYYRRNRFWYWLFGTDDWVAASWPSQSHRIAEELKSVKTSRR
ncbi:MAG: hypothetical protein B7Y80_06515 [Hyphomicrobium sp. 32-62-53]|nr:MAG: hypothetical protein B7Z29_05005 [Hyphomicrobium sp. 12-62-95]OYY00281.1 MAG: hypothetical protein B7Y80_06515 [Hyphomicrobium sp. 32-62-53]